MPFFDRVDAGRRLAAELDWVRGVDVIVLGLPRGGVPVAFEVARALAAPLDVLVVRKLGLPHQPELAIGAIGEDGTRVLNPAVIRAARISAQELSAVEAHERAELTRRVRLFRADCPRLPLEGRTALVVDDGVATGATARAACQVAREQGATRVVLAIPVGAPNAIAELRREFDRVVCLEEPASFWAVGQWYTDFRATSDNEVVGLLQRARGLQPSAAAAAEAVDPAARDADVAVNVGPLSLAGHLTLTANPRGLIVFAHGSGSSRHSPRNRFVAGVLNQAGLGTLLFDLLTEREEHERSVVFDIDLLAGRLAAVTRWARAQPDCAGLPIGYFGASTGAAAALTAAAHPDAEVDAVVSRGGRPDLAAAPLGAVHAPTLLIVGGRDDIVLDLNRQAQSLLRCENSLAVVPGATHLFEEPGTLQRCAELARDWFVRHLALAPVGPRRRA